MKATQPKCYTVNLSDLTDSVNLGRSHYPDKVKRKIERGGRRWLYQTAHHEMLNLESLPLALVNSQ